MKPQYRRMPSVKIAGRAIGAGEPPYIVAELSANHGGSIDRALTVLEAAKAAGMRTGAFFNWEPLRDLFAPGALTVSFMFGSAFSPEDDDRVTEQAIDSLRRDRLDAVFFYLGWVDECGHKYGWMSDEYLEAIANADRCVGRLLDVWRALEPDRECALLVTSDHGGHERTHGVDCDEDMLVPWILEGTRVRKGAELKETVRIQDTCVTLAHLLGLPRAREWEGRVVSEALTESVV